ncbi:quinone-dependent dihydroorotate dehydrogenase [Alicyclobacillus sp.]|uniref:quinone-dependent dihydroorotate dehydrogenase n=1 Tax=Alicyclobacillus sp. TaxID=61169 RepID=UPI0025BB805A|nr:quinone-dependent dihydroorotate dehydrogenase [Alicyclobacillus sp.]MCL6515699.1 quinone-dependent dihydroorotate dehydrogenase [Alicyclobacillus sp.]
MYHLLRPVLFRMEPEAAHHTILALLARMPWSVRLACAPVSPSPALGQTLWGRRFPHPVGLAAGLDKNAVAVPALFQCGFSFVEVGTVTPRPQPGNPKPRLFRLPADEALINRMGFNNDGADLVAQRVHRWRGLGIIGVNLGKNKTTPNDAALEDYLANVRVFCAIADYLVINVSSPNTPGLRDLQAQEQLVPLVRAVLAERDRLTEGSRPPLLVKLAPDLSDEDLAELAVALTNIGVDGLIATNTTIARPKLHTPFANEPGGLSGKPLRERATAVVRQLYEATRGKIPIIGSGGVFSADDAYEKIRAGASLVQVYTGFIYRGPGIVREIADGLAQRLARDGFEKIEEAIGADHRGR